MRKTNRLRHILLLVSAVLILLLCLAGCAATPEYTVCYRAGDHAAAEASLPQDALAAQGEQITLAPAPAPAEGWQFEAWSDGEETYSPGESYTVTENVTFTALWTQTQVSPEPGPEPELEPQRKFTVTFVLGEHADAAYPVPAPVTAAEGEAVLLPSPAPERGYRFDGWYHGGVRVSEPFVPTEDTLLTAQFSLVYYRIVFEAAGAENPNTVTGYTVRDEAVILLDAYKRGYTFDGWMDAATGEILQRIDPSRAEDLTLRALFTAIRYPITYSLGGGENHADNPAFYTVESGDIALRPPMRAGYDFIGWTYAGQSNPVRDVTIPAGSVGEITFTAHWELHAYLVSVDGIPLVRLTMGERYALSLPVRRPDSTFMGWMRGGTLLFTPQDNVLTMGTEDVLLTTRWADHHAIAGREEALAVFADDGAEGMTLAADMTLYERVELSRPFLLDLGGHCVTFSAQTPGGFSFTGAAEVRNGTIRMQAEEADARACAITVRGGPFTADALTLVSDGAGIALLSGTLALRASEITAYGEFAVAADVSLGAGGPLTLTASSCSFCAEGKESAALLFNGRGTLTMSDCALTGGRQGLVLRRGDASVTGCMIASRMEGASPAAEWGSGAHVPMACAVAGDPVGNGTDANLTVSGTQFLLPDGVSAGRILLFGSSDLTGVARLSYSCDDVFLHGIAAAGGIVCSGAAYVLAGHLEEYHAAREVTCTSDGWRAYYVCPRCGSYFDLDGNAVTWEQIFLPRPAQGHFYTVNYDPESCVLSYGCSRGDTEEVNTYLEFSSDRGEVVVGEDAFHYSAGEFRIDLSEVSVKGLMPSERLVGFWVGDVYCPVNAIVSLMNANSVHAVIDAVSA